MGAAIGVTFDHGTVSLGPGATVILPPPLAQWFDVIVHRQELTPAQPA
jgi:hypothetical protein